MEKPGQDLTPFQRKLLQTNLKTDLRPEYRRRIEIMLLADTGQTQTQICEALDCSPDMARYWISMAQTGNAHRWSDRPMGRSFSLAVPHFHPARPKTPLLAFICKGQDMTNITGEKMH